METHDWSGKRVENSSTNGRGLDECEEDRRRILEEYPDIPKKTRVFYSGVLTMIISIAVIYDNSFT
jgi:hypothetical protein